jgi:5-oxoprolinase (ATP-hydrolysing)
VHDGNGDRIGFVVNRAHHAEIGGTRPGSMPPDATRLIEEGVAFSPMLLVESGSPKFDAVAARLRDAPHPSRAIDENLADLAAQLAANRLGARRLREVHDAVGGDRFHADLDALRRRCSRAIGELAHRLDGIDRTVQDALDDGTPLAVRIAGRNGRILIDFTGTGDVHPGNLNAPPAVTRAATLYALRLVAGEPIPLNEGVLDVVDLVVPSGLLSPRFTGDPASDPAVAIGNTETSQRVVDLLLEAFDAMANSQGTMNNLLLGDDTFGYYETICGGTGAGPDFDGADAVHSHMTNTRITDPEVLEVRYPLRLDEFSIRRGSGGRGRHRGGDGVIRAMTALRPLRGSLLGQHRGRGPRGGDGGTDGRPAIARVERGGGTVDMLPGIAAFELNAGDRLIIETPGGGGWGTA